MGKTNVGALREVIRSVIRELQLESKNMMDYVKFLDSLEKEIAKNPKVGDDMVTGAVTAIRELTKARGGESKPMSVEFVLKNKRWSNVIDVLNHRKPNWLDELSPSTRAPAPPKMKQQ